jgi:hypothetical protein
MGGIHESARSGGGVAIKFDSRRQHETVVVVCVLADEIHSAWRAINCRRRAEALSKAAQELVRVYQSFERL